MPKEHVFYNDEKIDLLNNDISDSNIQHLVIHSYDFNRTTKQAGGGQTSKSR